MNKRTRMALIFSLITVLSMSFISSFSFGDNNKKLTITVVGKDNLFQEKKEYTISELESNEAFTKEIEKDRKYNFNSVESDDSIKDINANGISIDAIINSLSIDKEEVNSIEFTDSSNEVFSKTKEELLSEKYYFKENSEKVKVDTILSLNDDYKKSEKDKKDALTFLSGLTEEEYNEKTIFHKKNINSIKISLLKDIPKDEQFKILGEREITVDSSGNKQLTTNFQKDNYLNGEIKWTSSDPNKVSVDENGLLKYLADGEVTITAKYKYRDKELSDSIKVNKKAPDPPPNPNPPSPDPPSPDPNPDPAPAPKLPNVLDDGDISNKIIEVTVDDDSGGSSSGGSSSGGSSSRVNNSGGSSSSNTISPSSTRRPSTSSRTTPSSSSSSRSTPSSANSRSTSRSIGTNRDSDNSSSRRSGTIRRITRSTTSRDDEDAEENSEESLRADRGVLTDADEIEEKVDIGRSRWKVFEVEQEEREMPKLNLSGEVNPIVMIALAVIVIIGGVQRYIKYLGSI